MPTSIRVSAALAALLFGFAACSKTEPIGSYPDGSAGASGNPDVPSSGTDVVPSPYCLAFGQPCATGADCCSTICDPGTLTCAASINVCTAAGGGCASATECCSMVCSGGRCAAGSCIADGQACTDSPSCCGGTCAGGVCQPLNPGATCRTSGNPCTASTECCSQLCEAGICKLGSSFCIQTGDVCSSSDACCSGDCAITVGNLGVCAPPPSGATYCSDGVDGTVCGDCNNCCSRLCAPYGPTGVKVCQPASGCRVNGDLCRRDSDCCGAAGTGLPGEGNVTCEIPAGKAVGICRNPRSCNPQGNVCHYKDYTCSVSSARNDCCAAVGNSGVCQLDFLGVPRCNGLGDTCIPTDGICSSAMDCCNLAPCVPDANGVLRCWGSVPAVDGGVAPPACVPTGGPCSTTADCCGGTCVLPVGSTQGICGVPQQPPAKTDAGVPDGGATTVCVEYGQICRTSADCCNDIPCWNGRCMYEIIP
jgi:hypothetical protein